MCAKENSAITCECSYRLPHQAAAVKKQVHISVSWLFSFSITVSQDLTHDFLILPRPALLTVSSEKFWWFTTQVWRLQLVMLSLSVLWAGQACCVSRQSPVPPIPAQASPLLQGLMWGTAILHGCKSKAQSCSSKESMRIFAFGIFMETGSCPKHIPRE